MFVEMEEGSGSAEKMGDAEGSGIEDAVPSKEPSTTAVPWKAGAGFWTRTLGVYAGKDMMMMMMMNWRLGEKLQRYASMLW